jgi:hypothetical protein
VARKPNTTPQKQKAQAEREARLAEALRANLRRRKDQKQGQKHAGEEGDTPTPEGQQKGET